jgi:hypothetical protein
LSSEFREFIHQGDENVFDIYVNIKVTSSVKELLEGLEVVLIREGLNNAFHQVLLSHGVFANYNDV